MSYMFTKATYLGTMFTKTLLHCKVNTQLDLSGTTTEVDPKARLEPKMETHLANAELIRTTYRHIHGEGAQKML